MLRIVEIEKSFYEKKVVNGFSLELEKGETVCLLGKSGIGKTTILKITAGLTAPDSGRIILNGEDVTNAPRHFGFMPQNGRLLPCKTVLQNLKLYGEKNVDNRMPQELRLEEYLHFYPAQLSGGIQKRLLLICTLLMKKEVNLLDEPFGALDDETAQNVMRFYKKKAQETGLSSIIVTHNKKEAEYLADRLIVLEQ
ncbi:MAG: ATP-binding cassette domain-containing protein [Oscillospiraceae bacterium]